MPPQKDVERVVNRWSAFIENLNERWDMHANRRTIIIVVVAGILFAYLYLYIIRPPENFPANELVSVPSGESLTGVSEDLYKQNVVRSPFVLKVLVTIVGRERTVHAGDYLFKEPVGIFTVARALATGAYGLEPERIRIPEGAMVKEMAIIFSQHLKRFDRNSFMTKALPKEGYLFPDTYNFLPNATEDLVIDAMYQNFESKIADLQPLIASSTHSLNEIVIMASILEREAYNTADRKMISGVLWNRIARGMALQVDAVFRYTLGKGTFQLTKADLASDSPYNTYRFKGLPPSPIGSPSLDSLKAALQPTKSKYLFFLADHKGVTHYCETYACQLANKAKYF